MDEQIAANRSSTLGMREISRLTCESSLSAREIAVLRRGAVPRWSREVSEHGRGGKSLAWL